MRNSLNGFFRLIFWITLDIIHRVLEKKRDASTALVVQWPTLQSKFISEIEHFQIKYTMISYTIHKTYYKQCKMFKYN